MVIETGVEQKRTQSVKLLEELNYSHVGNLVCFLPQSAFCELKQDPILSVQLLP